MAAVFHCSVIKYFHITVDGFLGTSKCVNPTPTLYQHLTDIIFRDLMKEKYVIPSQQSSITEDVSVLEGNALRYAAGYVVRHIFKVVKKSSHELKGDITDCLM